MSSIASRLSAALTKVFSPKAKIQKSEPVSLIASPSEQDICALGEDIVVISEPRVVTAQEINDAITAVELRECLEVALDSLTEDQLMEIQEYFVQLVLKKGPLTFTKVELFTKDSARTLLSVMPDLYLIPAKRALNAVLAREAPSPVAGETVAPGLITPERVVMFSLPTDEETRRGDFTSVKRRPCCPAGCGFAMMKGIPMKALAF